VQPSNRGNATRVCRGLRKVPNKGEQTIACAANEMVNNKIIKRQQNVVENQSASPADRVCSSGLTCNSSTRSCRLSGRIGNVTCGEFVHNHFVLWMHGSWLSGSNGSHISTGALPPRHSVKTCKMNPDRLAEYHGGMRQVKRNCPTSVQALFPWSSGFVRFQAETKWEVSLVVNYHD